jgi:4-hydroxy-tetrahydrodipicolinate synthase
MSKLGLCKDEVRLPLTPLSEPTKEKIHSALKHADLI